MKNVNLKFDFKNIGQAIIKRFSIVLWVVLGFVILAESWVIKSSVDKILTASDDSQFSNTQLVRVNFDLYDSIEKRLIENQTYLPPEPSTRDPFGIRTD